MKYVPPLAFGSAYCFLRLPRAELLWSAAVKCEENKKDYVEVDGVKQLLTKNRP